jgi:HK97 gp10 family phage protein
VGVGKKAFYARFHELGTSKMAAHPFLRPAVFENEAEIMRLLVGK